MASFPTSIWAPTTKNNNDTIQPSHMNDVQAEVVAIETAALTPASFTPTIISGGGGTPTYSVQVGRYVKIGKFVSAYGKVTLATKGTLAAGIVSIGGLPVATENTANADASVVIGAYGLTTSVVSLFGTMAPGTTTISLQINTAAATSGTNMTVADMSGTTTFTFAVQYVSA